MMSPLVRKLYQSNRDLSDYLLSQKEVSYQSQLDDDFKKVLLLAAASNLENQLVSLLKSFVASASRNCEPLISFVDKSAIQRQYHSYFKWDKNNPNHFFGLFGDDFLSRMKSDRQSDETLDSAVRAFLEIGRLRNSMVHNDYASFTLDKTAEEVFHLYEMGLNFMSYISDRLTQVLSEQDT